MEKISFIITNYNTEDYLQWSYESIRKNLHEDHEIILLDDRSTDKSWEVMKDIKNNDKNVIIHRNEFNVGIAYSYNKAIKLASNEVVCLLHTDMYVSPNIDRTIIKYLKDYDFITLLRVEPYMYPMDVDKVTKEFGRSKDEFKEQKFLEWANTNSIENKNRTEKRMFFPWCTTKTFYDNIGGKDFLFLKYMVDDDDFYLRIKLSGAKYTQVWEASVYHIPSRSTKFKNDDTELVDGDSEWYEQYYKSSRNFIRKWGIASLEVWNDNSDMVIPKKYDIGFVIKNCRMYDLNALEPWCSTLYVDIDYEEYIRQEQTKTLIDLSEKILPYDNEKQNDILVEFDALELTDKNFSFISNLPKIISESGEVGNMKYDIFRLYINKIKDYSSELIINTRR